MADRGAAHEPEEELGSADDAVQDAARLRALRDRQQRTESVVSVRVPLWALLDAIDHLPPDELRQVARRAEGRLAQQTG
jgi:hypothetical protein